MPQNSPSTSSSELPTELTRPISLDAAQADLRQFLDERGWYPADRDGRYYTTIHMMEEVGELARAITHIESERAGIEELRGYQPLELAELEIELGDVLCHVLKLAEAYGTSAEKCFVRTMHKNRTKYPLEKFKDSIPAKIPADHQ